MSHYEDWERHDLGRWACCDYPDYLASKDRPLTAPRIRSLEEWRADQEAIRRSCAADESPGTRNRQP
ncbi:MAG: hypothetical protein KDH15_12095 [Rhodocyclaceae bacterium]|nr:hypothetical protein [Rhodocyclaceae bacterium]